MDVINDVVKGWGKNSSIEHSSRAWEGLGIKDPYKAQRTCHRWSTRVGCMSLLKQVLGVGPDSLRQVRGLHRVENNLLIAESP